MDWRIEEGQVFLTGKTWSGSFPVERLEDWRRFYNKLADRRGGKNRVHFQPTIDALAEAAQFLNKGKADAPGT